VDPTGREASVLNGPQYDDGRTNWGRSDYRGLPELFRADNLMFVESGGGGGAYDGSGSSDEEDPQEKRGGNATQASDNRRTPFIIDFSLSSSLAALPSGFNSSMGIAIDFWNGQFKFYMNKGTSLAYTSTWGIAMQVFAKTDLGQYQSQRSPGAFNQFTITGTWLGGTVTLSSQRIGGGITIGPGVGGGFSRTDQMWVSPAFPLQLLPYFRF